MKVTCSLCSSRGRSDCPALGASICGPCCGSKRNSVVKCTADCRFNPFSPANYDGWLRIDSALNRKMMEYLSRYYDEQKFGKVVQDMMYAEDGQHALDVHVCKVFYEIKGSGEAVKSVLDEKPEFRLVEEAGKGDAPWPARVYDWFRKGESREIEKEMISPFRHEEGSDMAGILGRVYLGDKEIMVLTMSKLKGEFAKEMVERYWGDLLVFSRESVVDLAKQMAQRADRTLSMNDERVSGKQTIPPEIEEKLITEYYRKHYAKFLDDAVPALDGMTPRRPAKSAKMRPRLIDLMKGHIHGIEKMNKDKGFSISLDWVVTELGLKELQ